MLQSWYEPAFEREMACTERDFRSWLPGATRSPDIADEAPDRVRIAIPGGGTLRISMKTLPPRRIALMRMPRLIVNFAFDGIGDEARVAFMRAFDLHTLRGGG